MGSKQKATKNNKNGVHFAKEIDNKHKDNNFI